jgi:hypothetical protein
MEGIVIFTVAPSRVMVIAIGGAGWSTVRSVACSLPFSSAILNTAHFLQAGQQRALPIADYILGLERASQQHRERHHPQGQLFHRRPPVSIAAQLNDVTDALAQESM